MHKITLFPLGNVDTSKTLFNLENPHRFNLYTLGQVIVDKCAYS